MCENHLKYSQKQRKSYAKTSAERKTQPHAWRREAEMKT